MEKPNIYYTVEKESELISEAYELTGNKTINLYKIVDDSLVLIDSIESDITENSLKEVKEYLEENEIEFKAIFYI